MSRHDPIAVVGMAGLFPGAPNISALWANICAKFDATSAVRPERWIAPAAAMLSDGLQADKAYSSRCCLLPDLHADPEYLGLAPGWLQALDPLHRVALQAGRDAVSGSGAPTIDRERTGVILAALVLPTDASSTFTRKLLGPVMGRSIGAEAAAFRPAVLDPKGYFASRVASLPAAIVATALGLRAGSYTLDAACASSLYAVKLACDELSSGRADAMLAGGVARPDCLFTQVGFSQLRALSASGRCAPFDRDADGLVVGEGAGILVLKRLADARRDGDVIRGIIRGIGLSNDLRGNLLAPDSEGQLRAMRAAYAAAGWSPMDVDLIECHGAGTPVGDAAELASQRALWGEAGWQPGQCSIGSIKSMIGHLLTAAGAAGMIKTLLAMGHRTLPPTIHFRQAPAGSPLDGGPFRVQTEAEPWERRSPERPRRAAVSAFGFGGINAHLLLEEYDPEFGSRKAEDGNGSGEAGKGKTGNSARQIELFAPSAFRLPPSTVAIVGLSACIGKAASLEAFAQHLAKGESLIGPRPQNRWKACDEVLPELGRLRGCFLDEIAIEPGEFHIPPREIPDILPQHLLMLKTAAAAMADANLPLRRERPAMGALIGIDFDFEATNFHLRWYLDKMLPHWRKRYFPHLSDADAARVLADFKDACSPPLTASRTLGALGSMVASRIAREFRFGGPSFVVCAEEVSGLRALAIGARALQARELDAVLVGAVDLCGDLRWVAARQALHPDPARGQAPCFVPGEGAVACVLKRLDDAQAAGDRVYAVIRGIGAAGGNGQYIDSTGKEVYLDSLSQAAGEAGDLTSSAVLFDLCAGEDPVAGPIEKRSIAAWCYQRGISASLTSTRDAIGCTGAAAGLASVARAALGLQAGMALPGDHGSSAGLASAVPEQDGLQAARQPAPRHAGGGIRTAVAAASTPDGNCMHVVLESIEHNHLLPTIQKKPASRGAPIRIPVAGKPMVYPAPPRPLPPGLPAAEPPADAPPLPRAGGLGTDLIQGFAAVSEATTQAHTAFLEASGKITRAYAEALRIQQRLLEIPPAPEAAQTSNSTPAAPAAFSREQCLEFARGSAARVLGPEFAPVDEFAARVRLPDEPLMLVDRIVEIHGEKLSLGPGRIVTEHDVRAGAWYLDGGRAPVCISVEAGQADLFLCAYLGVDRVVRGRRTYRLLDATVEFHRGLPRPGETIRYAIEIEKFLRQGETYLFLFSFKGAIDGVPLITMTGGCAGFFTPQEVANSGGIILTEEEKQALPGKRPADWKDLVPLARAAYDDAALEALRRGDAAACFGKGFTGVVIPETLRLPGGRMRLIDRVLDFDPGGGRCGLGRIRAEADIHPDDWFLTCHFVDDMVMPGTLMYECCAHALRVMLQRMGWISDQPRACYEPVPAVKAVLKCRGPVTPATRHVVYEVDLREIGWGPQPFAVADANMYADGHHIVRFSGMSLQMTGVTRPDLERFWDRRPAAAPIDAPAESPAPVCSRRQLEAFACGKPSQAFGEPYAPFDAGRFIARLPSPPYLFMDRVTRAEPPPWVVRPGGWVEAELDVPRDAWHIAAGRCGTVPYCVILEAALQPCGWLAAYMGSALKSDKPLYFRNLGGHGILHREVGAGSDTLRVRTRVTHVSEVTDMIIEHFDFAIHGAQGIVYDGSTYFGFFTRSALERQEGIRGARETAGAAGGEADGAQDPFVFADAEPLTPDDPKRAPAVGLAFPARALRMVDRIEIHQPRGGPKGLGFVRGIKQIDPSEWFFAAHFHQDPVCPGSLGLESFLQLVKFAARARWPQLAESHRFGLPVGRSHRWIYRGQILPANRRITVEATISALIETPHPGLIAEGYLMVDGLPIYRMEDFGVVLIPRSPEGNP